MDRFWKEGTIGIPVKGGKTKIAHYWAKVYDEAVMIAYSICLQEYN